MVEVNMPSQSVYLVKYWQYNTSNSEWELNTTKNSNAANSTSAGGATDFTSSTWKPWAKTTSSCYLVGKPDAGTLPMSANRGTSNSFYSWEVTDIQLTSENSFITTTLTPSDVYLKQAWEFTYTGSGVPFAIPAAGTYCFECWGAQGGDATRIYNYGPNTTGGKGGYTMGTYSLLHDLTVYVYVGQQGGTDITSSTRTFNGGGGAYGTTKTVSGGTRGGGASDIRLMQATSSDGWSTESSLKTRIVIAGGGGGTSWWYTETDQTDISGNAAGGGGGGLKGCNGHVAYRTVTGTHYTASEVASKCTVAGGGTQTTVGTQPKWDGTAMSSTVAGVYGMGASGVSSYQGAGGGGHYGGAAAGAVSGLVCTGSGGSGFVSGASGCVAISGFRDASDNSQVRYNNISYKCTDSSLIDGESSLPKSSGLYKETYSSTDKETGHSGDGFVRIVQISVD